MIVPQSAIFREGEGWAVYRVDADGVAHKAPVELGLRNGVEAQVTAGLAEGDTVVDFPGDQAGETVSVVQR